MTSTRLDRVRQSVWGPTSTRIRRTRWREPAIAAYRASARYVLVGPPPKVFANSIPKSGTHLLTQLLGGVPKLWFSGDHVIDRFFRADLEVAGDGRGEFDVGVFQARLRRVRNGQYLTAHMGALPGVPESLREQGFSPILMIRDPRDIVVSLAHYHATNTRLHTFNRFSALGDTGAQLMAAIRGMPRGGPGERYVPTLGERLHKYRGWLDRPEVCVVRFEDLVGSAGGGSDDAQRDAVRRILQQCRRPADDVLVDRLAQSVFAPHAATFRRGAIGDWRNHLTDEHLAAIDEVAPGELAAFGYA